MHIGLIVGIGPAATDHYYRHLISAMGRAGRDLTLTMAHADTPTLLRNQAASDADAQVEIYKRLTGRLASAGAERVAITSIAGHFCIQQFTPCSPVPVIDLLHAVGSKIKERGFKRVGLLGTRVVMESKFYGALGNVEVVAPVSNLMEVHEAYISMATAGAATLQHEEVFMRAGCALVRQSGCETVLLAGTDLALVFRKGQTPGFPVFDCAQVHADAIAEAAMQTSASTGAA